MSPGDEKNTQILIQIAGDIGRTREATETLKDNYAVVSDDIKDIKTQLIQTVKTSNCDERHHQVSHSMEIIKGEIIKEIQKGGSNLHPIITARMLKSPPPTLQELTAALEEKTEEKKEKRRKTLITWLSIISVVSGLLVGSAIGIYKIALFANKLETMVATSNEEVRSEIKSSKVPRIVYVKIPAPLSDIDDANMSTSPSPTSKQPKTKIRR